MAAEAAEATSPDTMLLRMNTQDSVSTTDFIMIGIATPSQAADFKSTALLNNESFKNNMLAINNSPTVNRQKNLKTN